MSNFNLPEDLLILVLVRFPVKSLLQLKSVSKSWNTLISSSEFIMLHLNHYYQEPSLLFWEIREAALSSLDIHTIEFSITTTSTGENIELGFKKQLLEHPFDGSSSLKSMGLGLKRRRLEHPFDGSSLKSMGIGFKRHNSLKSSGTCNESCCVVDSPDDSWRPCFVGSCNGLLCLLKSYGKYYQNSVCEISLSNPLTKSSRVLPERPGAFDYYLRKKTVSFYGFGYDDVNDDYKVMIASNRHRWDSYPDDVYEYEYEVYRLQSDSWCSIRSYLDSRYHVINKDSLCGSDGVLGNCALHWMFKVKSSASGDIGSKWKNSILAFDLTTDKHRFLPLPEVLEQSKSLRFSALNNGCLVISIKSELVKPVHGFEFWVMKDYGMKDSWTRIGIPNLPYSAYFLTPVTLLESEKRKLIIFYNFKKDGLILLYDLVSRQVVKEAKSSSFVRCFHNTRQQFVGSLVQPHPSFQRKEICTRVKKILQKD